VSTLIPVLTAYEKEHLGERQPLPERYLSLSDEEMDRRILAAKRTLGRRLVILGHHYQRDEVIKFADYTGDSYKLAGQVSRHPDAEFIVFCGVHFMAESADVLSGDRQQVILPDLAAGCSMADMADPEQLEVCWRDLEGLGIVPGRSVRLREGRIPRIGWAEVDRLDETFYFAHSYAAETPCATAHSEDIVAVAERGSFTGVQFHPEKSGAAGARFLESLCLSLV